MFKQIFRKHFLILYQQKLKDSALLKTRVTLLIFTSFLKSLSFIQFSNATVFFFEKHFRRQSSTIKITPKS